MLSVHRYLSALAIAFVATHVVAILADGFVDFGVADVLVPMVSSWHPIAVAWGIVGMYVLLAVEGTSLARHRLSPRMWRGKHLLGHGLLGPGATPPPTPPAHPPPPPPPPPAG